ncbi:hypothetical protein [Pectobacterium brasiliense]|uniref:hypothetical protein n=1 Tax=Pectobacterium brasiliense TaxID=180957 RepID=UPI0015DE8DE0|nr:hypothetical protein [Pectobacterium brasiliense]MBA0215348.1 hypothetical protein [Pectobacterium brasiliense]
MANNNQSMSFTITGNSQGLVNALNQGGNAFQQFGNNAGGILGQLSGNFTSMTSGVMGLSGGLVGFAGAAGLVVGGLATLISGSADYANQLNEISRNSGLTVEDLQRLRTLFQGLGLDVEKFGDLNRDVLDHLGDAFRDGSGPAEDMKAYGLKLNEFNQYLNKQNGGIEALTHAYYKLRDAGKSTAEITNMLETLGSDGSKLVDVLKQYSNQQDFLNALQKQHVGLTNDNARAYRDYEKNVLALSESFSTWKANALAPTVIEITKLFDLLNKDWTGSDFNEMLRQFWYGGDTAIAKLFRKLDGVQEVGYSIDVTTRLDNQAKDLLDFVNNNTKKPEVTPTGGWVNQEQERAKAEAAARKAAAEAERLKQKQLQAQREIQNQMSQIGISDSAVRIQRFNYQYDEMERKLKENAKVTGLTEQETTELLTKQYAARSQAYKQMVDEMLKETDPEKLQKNLAAIGDNLSTEQRSDLLKNMNKNAGIDRDDSNPFDTRGLGLDLDALHEQYNNELILNNQLLANKTLSLEQYLERKKQLEDKYNQDSMNLMVNQTNAQLSMMGGMANSLGTILSGAFGKQSGAAKAAFAVSKGLAIAESMIAIQQSVAKAMALGWPMGIAAGAQALAQGASIISTIKGTTVGQAHDGIDNVPNTGTWNLEKGERVVGAALNQDLSRFLKSSDDNSSTGNIEINAPLIVQGSGQLTDAEFNRMLHKHRDSLTQALRQSQQRNT